MGLGEEIRAAQSERRGGPKCGVARTLESLSDEDRADLIAAMDDPDVMHSTIARVLDGRGFALRDQTVQRHRNGKCACAR